MIDSLFYIFIIVLLLIISFIDVKKMIIPDSILLIGFIGSITYMLLSRNINIENISGSLIGFLIFLSIALLTNAMGGGDIKLMSLLGFIFGINGILFIIVFSFVLGAVTSIFLLVFKIKKRKDNIAFAPFISIAVLIYMLYGIDIIQLYLT